MNQLWKQRRSRGARSTTIGRVGALALFLGVGSVITPLPSVAVADSAESAEKTESSTSSDSPRSASPRHSRGGRPTVSDQSSGSFPSTAVDRRRSKDPAEAAPVGIPKQRTTNSAVASPAGAVSAIESTAALPVVEKGTSAVLSLSVVPAVDTEPSMPVFDEQTTISAPPSVEAAPAMNAAPRGAVSALDAEQLAWLGDGGDPMAPIAASLGWSVLAVSRRELSRAATVAPAAEVSVSEPTTSVLSDALAQPDAATALVAAAKQFVLTVAGGGNSVTALRDGIRSLEEDPIFSEVSLSALLADPGLPQTVGSATASVVTALAADPQVRAAVGEAINGYLASALADLPSSIAPSLADAAVTLLADPAAGEALGSVAASIVSTFLGQPGVVSGLSGVAYQLQGALNGNGFGSALDAAWVSLRTVSALRDGLVIAATAGVGTALSDAGLVAALGTAATSLVADLSSDPSTWRLIGDLLGPTYGDPIVSLLSDPATAGDLADTVGTVLTGFLGQPGVSAALSGAAGRLASALLSGAEASEAVDDVLGSLQTDPAIAAALDSTVAVALRGILGNSAVQDAVSVVAEQVVVTLIGENSNLSPVVSQLLGPVVDSLIEDPAVQDLISDIAPAIIGGTPAGELTTTVVQAVIDQPALQSAVGTAVGQAVSSLIGDNPIGNLVGRAAGRTVTSLIRVAARLAPLFNNRFASASA